MTVDEAIAELRLYNHGKAAAVLAGKINGLSLEVREARAQRDEAREKLRRLASQRDDAMYELARDLDKAERERDEANYEKEHFARKWEATRVWEDQAVRERDDAFRLAAEHWKQLTTLGQSRVKAVDDRQEALEALRRLVRVDPHDLNAPQLATVVGEARAILAKHGGDRD